MAEVERRGESEERVDRTTGARGLARWLWAPVFEGDEEKSRVASIVHLILILFLARLVVTVVSTPFLYADPGPAYLINLSAMVTVVAGLWQLRRGRVAGVALGLSFSVWSLVTALVWLGGGTSSPAVINYFSAITIAALTLRWQLGMSVGLATVVVVAGFGWAGQAGYLPAPRLVSTPQSTVAVIVLNAAIVTLVVLVSSRSHRRALARARASESHLAESLAQLEATQDRLERTESLEAVGLITSSVSHDFKNYLTVLYGTSDALRDEATLDPEVRSDVEDMHEAARQASELVEQILDVGRKVGEPATVLDLGAELEETTPVLTRLVGNAIELTVRIAPRVPRVHFSAGRFRRLVMNLVANARDAMPDGGKIEVSLDTQAPTGQTGPLARLRVKDDGAGMDAATQTKIFDPFFTTKSTNGTGLGLGVCREIVEDVGGEIGVESELGRGSVFTVRLPTAQE